MIHFISIERNGLGNIVTNRQDVSEPFVTSQRASGKSQSWRRMARIEFFREVHKQDGDKYLYLLYLHIIFICILYVYVLLEHTDKGNICTAQHLSHICFPACTKPQPGPAATEGHFSRNTQKPQRLRRLRKCRLLLFVNGLCNDMVPSAAAKVRRSNCCLSLRGYRYTGNPLLRPRARSRDARPQ